MSQTLIRTDGQPTRGQLKPLKECKTLGEAFETKEFFERIKSSVPTHVRPDRMLRTFIQATSKNPDLLKCNLRSVIGGMLTLSQLGLEPNTPLGQAYLIPFQGRERNPETGKFDKEVTNLNVILGYQGLLDLSYRAPKFKGVQAHVVYVGDHFSFEYGSDAHVRHKPAGHQRDGEAPIWAYAHAQLEGGQMFEVIPWSEILRIRNSSQGFRAALAAKENAEKKGWNAPKGWTEAPWVKHEIPMARKTAFRALSKWLPRSAELAAAVALDERQDDEVIDFSPVVDGADFTENELPGVTVADVAPRPDAAFGRRTHEDLHQDVEHIPASRQQAAPPPVPQRTPKPESISFEAWLLDENGEAAGDYFIDAVEFARAFEVLWQKSTKQETLVEQNRDGLNEAASVSAEAKAIIDSILTSPAQSHGAFSVVTVPEGRGGWENYPGALEASLNQGVTPDRFDEWFTLQKPGIARATRQVQMKVGGVIAKWAAAAGIELPEDVRAIIRGKPQAEAPTQAKEEQKPMPEATSQAASDAEAGAAKFLKEAVDELQSNIAKSEQSQSSEPLINFLANTAFQRKLAKLAENHRPKYREFLDACAKSEAVMRMINELQIAWPKFHQDVIDRSLVQGN